MENELTQAIKELQNEWEVYEMFRPQKQPNYIRGRVILRALITFGLALKQLNANILKTREDIGLANISDSAQLKRKP